MNTMLLVVALGIMAPGPKEAPKKEAGKLDGEWAVESIEGENKKDVANVRFQFVDGKVFIHEPKKAKPEEAAFTADYTKKIPEIDIRPGGAMAPPDAPVIKGIFRITGDKLELCFAKGPKGAERPTEFKSDEKSGAAVITLKRVKAE